MQTEAIGRVCLPMEPVNRAVVNDYMSTMTYQIQRSAGDMSLVNTQFYLMSSYLLLRHWTS